MILITYRACYYAVEMVVDPQVYFAQSSCLLYNQGFITAVSRVKKVVMRLLFLMSISTEFELTLHLVRLC